MKKGQRRGARAVCGHRPGSPLPPALLTPGPLQRPRGPAGLHTHTRTCTHRHTCTSTCTHRHTHACTQKHRHTRMYTHTQAHTDTCTHTKAHAHTGTHVCMAHAHTGTHAQAHTHVHTQAHAHRRMYTKTQHTQAHVCTQACTQAHTARTQAHTHMYTHKHTHRHMHMHTRRMHTGTRCVHKLNAHTGTHAHTSTCTHTGTHACTHKHTHRGTHMHVHKHTHANSTPRPRGRPRALASCRPSRSPGPPAPSKLGSGRAPLSATQAHAAPPVSASEGSCADLPLKSDWPGSGRMSRPHSEGSCRHSVHLSSLPPCPSSFLSFIISLFLNVLFLLMLCSLWDPGFPDKESNLCPLHWGLDPYAGPPVMSLFCLLLKETLCRAGPALPGLSVANKLVPATITYVWKQVPRGWAFRQSPS